MYLYIAKEKNREIDGGPKPPNPKLETDLPRRFLQAMTQSPGGQLDKPHEKIERRKGCVETNVTVISVAVVVKST